MMGCQPFWTRKEAAIAIEGRQLRVERDSPIPLSTQISDQIHRLIASGVIEQEERLPSVRPLAERLGVNLHTVRAAYARLEELGLVVTCHGSGTRVVSATVRNPSRAGRSPPSHTIGVILPALNPFYEPMLDGIEGAQPNDPWLPFICNCREETALAARYLDQLIARNVEGAIVTSIELSVDTPGTKQITEAAAVVPTVFADCPGAPGPSIEFDLEGAGFLSANHLLEHNHDRVGVITPPTDWPSVAEVYRGVVRALHSSDRELQAEHIARVTGFSIQAGYEGAERLLQAGDRVTAVLAFSDTLAVGALRAFKDAGLSTPEEVALMGIGDIEMAATTDPPLSTVSLPSYEMGLAATTTLQRLIDGESLSEARHVLPTELILRSSCGCDPSRV